MILVSDIYYWQQLLLQQVYQYKEDKFKIKIRMFKRSQQSGSTKKLRRNKLIDSSKNIVKEHSQTEHNNIGIRNKIMLTDLCPEEKSKIGDLVKTLEARKKQNKVLQQKISELQTFKTSHQKDLEQSRIVIEEFQQREKQQLRQIEQLLSSSQEQSKHIQKLRNQIKSYKQQQKQMAKVDQFSMTDQVFTNSQACQIVPKRKKQKQKLIQTQTIQNVQNSQTKRSKNRGYPNNSRSFEKIMKVSKNSLNHPKQTHRQQNQRTDSRSRNISKSRAGSIQASDEQPDDFYGSGRFGANRQQNSPLHRQDQGEAEGFDQLAQKWLQLKENNRSKIKQSYRQSKRKMNQLQIPSEFSGRGDYNYQQESFGVHNYQEQAHGNEQIDQIQLNKILKSKNFSASRLLQDGKIGRQNAVQRKIRQSGSKNIFERSYRGANNKASNKNRLQKSEVSNSRNIDFYQTDLLDLVNSINPH